MFDEIPDSWTFLATDEDLTWRGRVKLDGTWEMEVINTGFLLKGGGTWIPSEQKSPETLLRDQQAIPTRFPEFKVLRSFENMPIVKLIKTVTLIVELFEAIAQRSSQSGECTVIVETIDRHLPDIIKTLKGEITNGSQV